MLRIILIAITLVLSHHTNFLFAQNVGIGTITPTEKLDVSGNLKADTLKSNAILLTPNAGAGKILTSDDAGNATWENMSTPPGDSDNDNVGYGMWGDCSTNGNISEYNPVADEGGEAGDYFGNSVSISGNYAIAGAYLDDWEGGINQGSASFYAYNGDNWVFTQKIKDEDGETLDYFGSKVSISGNYAIIGAYNDTGVGGIGQGSASIYQFDGSNWVFMQKITDPEGDVNDRFGFSVSVSENFAIIGSYTDDGINGTDQGSASIYQFDGSSWIFMQKLMDPDGASGDNFGASVSLSVNYAIIGAYGDDGINGTDQGSASIFHFNGDNWVLIQKLTDPTGAANDIFGVSVSISDSNAIVGAQWDDASAGIEQGSASIYHNNGSDWTLVQKLTHHNAAPSDYFGFSVCISGNYAIVGVPRDDVSSSDQGSSIIYKRIGNSWQRLQFVSDPSGNPNEMFGNSAVIDGLTKRFLISAPLFSEKGKIVFGKVN